MPSTAKVDLEELGRKLQQVFPVPKVLARMLEVINDPQATVAKLEQVFKYDPSFSLKILSLANSATPSKVSNIRMAITSLGFNFIKSLVIQASVNKHLRFETEMPGFSGAELWKHSVGVGTCAEMISRRFKLGSAADSYTLGLLHDMGQIIEYQFYHEDFLAVVAALDQTGSNVIQCERARLGMDHAELASLLFAKWNLPEKFMQVVGCHHRPLQAPEDLRPTACAIALADHLVRRCHFGYHYALDAALPDGIMEILGLKALDLDVLVEDFEQEVLDLTLFLN